MGRMIEPPPDLQALHATREYHLREATRAEQMIAERQKTHDEPLYHDLSVKRRERLRLFRRALLGLLLVFAPVARDVLRAILRALGVDL